MKPHETSKQDTSESPAAASAPSKPSTVSIPIKKPRSLWARVALLLLILTLLAGLVAGFLWMLRTYDKSTISGLRNDVASLNSRLKAAETERSALENRIAGMQTVARLGEGNDEEQIVTAAKQFSASFLKDAAKADVELNKKDGDQAVASVRSSQGKHNVYLKKTNEIWTPVWAGKSAPSKEQRTFYDLTIE